MSFKSKNIIYQNFVAEDDIENEFEEVMEDEMDIDQNINIIKKEVRENPNFSEINSSFDGRSEFEEEEEDNYSRNSESVFRGVKKEWPAEYENQSKSMESFDSEDERTEFYIEKGAENEEEDDGEETIAMFVTASGQQLALYAVEDSDDYFAVAVYDESGEPPSNFQFLMKSDVERLIREGAVRTVKKPTQIKRQLVTTQAPVFMPKEEITGDIISKAESQIEAINRRYTDNRKTKVTTNYVKPRVENNPVTRVVHQDDSESEEEFVEQSTVQYILCDGDQSDTELTFDDIQASLQGMKAKTPKPVTKQPPMKKPLPERKKTNNGLVYISSPPVSNTSYRGTYYPSRNIVVEAPPSSPPPQTSVKRSHISNTSIIGSKQNHGIKRDHSPMSNLCTPNTSMNFSDSFTFSNSQSKVKRSRKQQLTSVNRGDSEIIIQPASMLDEEEEEPTPRKKGKRRKKSAAHEKSLKPTRKSTRRRRTRVEIIDIDIDEDSDDTQKEVLEITIDENKEKDSSDKENEVIMVGDSDDDEEESSSATSLKCKHCSKIFKHRRILDSHIRMCMKLRGKSRRLNDRRTISSSESEEENPKKKKSYKEKNSKLKKEYSCKTCEEKFDMVVSLARHVRAEHSPRKRGRPSKADTLKMKMQMRVEVTRAEFKKKNDGKIEEEKKKEKILRKEETSEEEDVPEKEEALEEEKEKVSKTTIVTIRPKKKKISHRLDRKWRIMEQTCIKCSRWFPSISALDTHSLQHLTKKSGRILKYKQMYCCPICNKVFKSAFMYMKHKRTHINAKKYLDPENSEKLKKKLSEEKLMSKTTASKNRESLRKLRSNV